MPATADGRPWYGERYHGSPEHRALQARQAEQQRAAAERDEARLERERRIEAQVAACQEQNRRAQHSARLYGQREYQHRNCDALRRQP
ncbi:MAG: hypothetical protein JJU18_11025 [Oceanicaulis sp.]|nr:hypothetical protein [Oceanicaulis sp.]